MIEPQKVPNFKRSRGRIRSRPSISESISKSRTTILINMVIEGAAAVIMIAGFTYLIRFLFYWRNRMVDIHFNVFLGTLVFFAVGWSTYIFIKLRNHYELFKKAGTNEENIKQT